MAKRDGRSNGHDDDDRALRAGFARRELAELAESRSRRSPKRNAGFDAIEAGTTNLSATQIAWAILASDIAPVMAARSIPETPPACQDWPQPTRRCVRQRRQRFLPATENQEAAGGAVSNGWRRAGF